MHPGGRATQATSDEVSAPGIALENEDDIGEVA